MVQQTVVLFEFLALLFGLIYYKKYFKTNLKYFLFLLILTFGIELYYTISKTISGKAPNNALVYNILDLIKYCYYFFLFYTFVKRIRFRKIILSIGIVYLLSVIIEFGFVINLNESNAFNSYSFSFGALLLAISIGLYIIELLKSDEVLFIKKSLLFWISSGLLIYYVGALPFFISFRFLSSEELANSGMYILYILFSLGIIMNSCFIFGFLWSKRLSS